MKHTHYTKDVSHLQSIDVYRVLELYKVFSPPLQHAAKKILCAGERGAKDEAKDIQEAIDSLVRWQNMQAENKIELMQTECTVGVEIFNPEKLQKSFNAQ